MAHIFNAEKSQFIQSAIDIYGKNKVGQYSKYLDSQPTFVTYYSVNQAMSRTDIGLGQAYDELGPSSPLRYNKITELPLYKIPTLQPQGNYEDGTYDVDIDLSDVTVLPNTVIPKPYDFFCIALPNSKKLLFRVNEFRHNTIQSNDFYMLSADLRHSGDNCCDEIEKLVVESYHCVFENIGTQDNCFIKLDDEDEAEELMVTIDLLSTMYHDLFYDRDIGDYLYFKQFPVPYNYFDMRHCYYDIFLAKFINDSMLFFTGDNMSTSVVTYDDTEPVAFDFQFKHTLWYAIMTKDTSLLARYPYYFNSPISKSHSPIVYHVEGKCFGFNLILDSQQNINRNDLSEYMPHKLIKLLLDGPTDDDSKCNCGCMNKKTTDFSVLDVNQMVGDTGYKPYIPEDQTKPYIIKDKNNTSNTNASDANDESIDFSYVYNIIYNYMNDNDVKVDRDALIRLVYRQTLWSYHMIPILIYVLKKVYSGYFKKINS